MAKQYNSWQKMNAASSAALRKQKQQSRAPRPALATKSANTKDTELRTPAERSCLAIIVTSTLCIIAASLTSLFFNPERQMERTLSHLAHAYYTEYLYPQLTQGSTDQLASYAESGLPIVKLRQLLHYTDDNAAQFAGDFDNSALKCDTNNSRIIFYPLAPYGPNDYTITTNLYCENLTS